MPRTVDFCDLQSLHQRLADLKGQVVVAQHFATWCGGCVEELPLICGVLSSLKAVTPPPSVALVGICWELFLGGEADDDTRDGLLTFAAEHGLDAPIWVYTGEPAALMDRFGIVTGTIPHTIVYGKGGDVVERFAEPFADAADAERLRRAIEIALARP